MTNPNIEPVSIDVFAEKSSSEIEELLLDAERTGDSSILGKIAIVSADNARTWKKLESMALEGQTRIARRSFDG